MGLQSTLCAAPTRQARQRAGWGQTPVQAPSPRLQGALRPLPRGPRLTPPWAGRPQPRPAVVCNDSGEAKAGFSLIPVIPTAVGAEVSPSTTASHFMPAFPGMDGQTDRARTWGQRAPGSAGLGMGASKGGLPGRPHVTLQSRRACQARLVPRGWGAPALGAPARGAARGHMASAHA